MVFVSRIADVGCIYSFFFVFSSPQRIYTPTVIYLFWALYSQPGDPGGIYNLQVRDYVFGQCLCILSWTIDGDKRQGGCHRLFERHLRLEDLTSFIILYFCP